MALFWKHRRKPKKAPTPGALSGSEPISRPSDMLALLRSCCRSASPAMLISPDIGAVTAGRFKEVTGNAVVFELVSEKGPPDMSAVAAQFKPFTTCTVGFSLGTRAGVFLSAVRELADAGTESMLPHLTVEFPKSMTNLETRKTFRVPVYGNPSLDISIRSGKKPVKGAAHDISFGGMLVEFPEPGSLGFDVGDLVETVLEYGNKRLDIRSEIRREERRKDQPTKYGFIFPEFYNRGEVDPPEEFRRMVKELETDWLRSGPGQSDY